MEWLGLAGVMASALGLVLTILFGMYVFLVNGPRTREVIERGDQRTQEMFQKTQEMIRAMHVDTQKTLETMDRGQQRAQEMMRQTQEMMRAMHADTQKTLEKMDGTLHHLADLIRVEGERTREEIRTQRA